MSYSVKTITVFERQVKRLMRKYPSLKKEVLQLISELKEDPTKGTSIANNCAKIRLAIGSKAKGKSGGARIITHCAFRDKTVYLLSIYDKSEIGNLSNDEVLDLLKLIP